MLMLNTQAWTIEGLQIFADHADKQQFWFLPGPVKLARRREDGRAEFTFIKVRAADAAADKKGGGFLTFTVDLQLDPDLERRILAKLAPVSRGKPRLSVVPFDEGTVRVVALDFDSAAAPPGGAAPPPPQSFRAVERALGATVPSLDAANRASFALTLTQEGATIIEKAFEQGGTPVGVIYDLKYTGMRPALSVTITANMSRVFDQFAASGDAQRLFVRGGVDMGFEKLVQDGAIRIEVQDFIGATDRETKEKWALDFFKDQLLQQYFTPTLTVGELRGGMPQAESLDAVMKRGELLRPPPTPQPTKPTKDEPEAKTGPKADPADSPTAGKGLGGTPANTVPTPPAGKTGGDSATEHTGHQAGAADGAALGSPAAAGLAPALAAAGPAKPPAAGGATSATPAADAGSQAVASFRMRKIKQEERKTLTFSYNRSEAAQRGYAPQGFFGLLAADLDKASHLIEVDLDDPFFRAMDIRVTTIADMAAIGLDRVQVALSYGTAADPGGVKTREIEFKGQDAAEQGWQVFQNDGDEQVYRYTVQYHFKSDGVWDGSRLSYQFGPFETGDRTLVLKPHERLGFAPIAVVAGKVDWGQIDRIEVKLDAGGRSRTVTLTQAAPEAVWKLRLDDPANRKVVSNATFVMKDRTRLALPEQVGEAGAVVVDDPFPDGLALQLIPILDAERTRMAFLDFDYADPASGVKRAERFRLTPADTDREVRIGLPRGAARGFRYRVTVVPKTGAMAPGQFIDATETLIAVAD